MKILCSLLLAFLVSVTCFGADFIFLSGEKPTLVGKGVSVHGGYVRNWNGAESGPEWTFTVPRDGAYYLNLNMSSPGDQGGIAEIWLDGKKVKDWNVHSTKNFDDFQTVRIWEGKLKAGEHKLKITAGSLKSTYLMDIKYGFFSTDPSPKAWEEITKQQREKIGGVISKATSWNMAMDATARFLKDERLLPETKKWMLDSVNEQFPHQNVWLRQDIDRDMNDILQSENAGALFKEAVDKVLAYSPKMKVFAREAEQLKQNPKSTVRQWAALYEKMCYARRQVRLDRVRELAPRLIFAKHHVFGSVSGIYLITETEGSDKPSAICTLDLRNERNGQFAREELLVDAGEGIVRDPELSFDGKRLLYAKRPTKKHYDTTFNPVSKPEQVKLAASGFPDGNYQIYELDRSTGKTRQLTTTETYGSNMEPCYLPNGDILFSSARIVQHITCGWGDLSNLFIMDKDGKYARRIGFDQTNTASPSVLNDGRVVFTRRDYNDRGQSSAHALFQMNPDGTAQTEYYGNQTGLPNSFQHARAIPNSNKVICIIGGYHTTQGGKLALMDVTKGVELDQGIVEMPGYRKPASGEGYDDNYGKQGEQYSNPYALTETDYLISIAPRNGADYSLYYLNDKGERELLVSSPGTSCLQVIPDRPRPCPETRPTSVDYSKDEGVFYVQDVYYGEAAKGIKPGSIKKIRVIEMLYKNSTIGTGRGVGPGGCWDTVTPTGHGLATFDSKKIIGDATVYEDGSAMFKAPARKPLYFQLLDDKNRVVQTMRSWTTLMPAEKFSCIGCHEDKNQAPLNLGNRPIASTKPAEELVPFHGPPRAFSYIKEVQPVFDKNCISCHREGGEGQKLVLTAQPYVDDPVAKRRYYRSYYELTKARLENGHRPEEFGFAPNDKVWGPRIQGQRQPDEPNKYVSWYTRFELMHQYPPYRAGAVRSGMVNMLEKGHKDVKLSLEEWDKICAWIDLNIPFAGEYDESNLWSDTEKDFYKAKVNERLRNEEIEARNIRDLVHDKTK